MRLLRLAVLTNAAAKLKLALLALLIMIAALMFLTVEELARASSSNLDDAMSSDLGTLGSYAVTLDPHLGMDRAEALSLVRGATSDVPLQRMTVAVELPALHPECPPYRALGVLSVAVLLDDLGNPAPFGTSTGLPVSSDVCLAGLVIPSDAVREPTGEEKKLFGFNMILHPDFETAARLTSTEPTRLHVGLITGRTDDDTARLREALRVAFRIPAARAGIPLDDAVTVQRTDDGQQVRTASDGIKLVYNLIGWGVLIVGGLGLLVSELIVLRDRNWFLGLARAVGAPKPAIGALIVLDILIALVLGMSLAVLTATLAAPAISAFGESAFHTHLRLLRPQALLTLTGGAVFMLLAGAAYPAWRATRLDPLDVLERR